MDRCGVSGVPDLCINADRSAIVQVCHLGKPTLKLSDLIIPQFGDCVKGQLYVMA